MKRRALQTEEPQAKRAKTETTEAKIKLVRGPNNEPKEQKVEPEFIFWKPDGKPLVDKDLTLILTKTHPATTTQPPWYEFEMRHTHEKHKMGGISFRIASHDHPFIIKAGHLGYSVRPQCRGKKYSSRACKLLLFLATHHGLDTLSIIVASDNLPSIRICQILGAEFVEEYEAPFNLTTQKRQRFTLDVKNPLEGKKEAKDKKKEDSDDFWAVEEI